ncbi:alsin [Anaeramoeba ignava]|uniref:Alsin n=1 Tax=Anaeramoeba ignava TaxID=1746090 RepID=A0A9Q0LMM9_ANAIG|nr:alsin [Anaeramoeba ignava]
MDHTFQKYQKEAQKLLNAKTRPHFPKHPQLLRKVTKEIGSLSTQANVQVSKLESLVNGYCQLAMDCLNNYEGLILKKEDKREADLILITNPKQIKIKTESLNENSNENSKKNLNENSKKNLNENLKENLNENLNENSNQNSNQNLNDNSNESQKESTITNENYLDSISESTREIDNKNMDENEVDDDDFIELDFSKDTFSFDKSRGRSERSSKKLKAKNKYEKLFQSQISKIRETPDLDLSLQRYLYEAEGVNQELNQFLNMYSLYQSNITKKKLKAEGPKIDTIQKFHQDISLTEIQHINLIFGLKMRKVAERKKKISTKNLNKREEKLNEKKQILNNETLKMKDEDVSWDGEMLSENVPREEQIQSIKTHINKIIGSEAHPISRALKRFKMRIQKNYNMDLKQAKKEIRIFCENSAQFLKENFAFFDESTKDVNRSRALIQNHLVKSIYEFLFPLYVQEFKKQNKIIENQLKKLENHTLADFKVRERFWLIPEKSDSVNENTENQELQIYQDPYIKAIVSFQTIPKLYSPIKKIKIILKIKDEIEEAITEFYKDKEIKPGYCDITADDNLQLFLYTFLKANIPSPYSEMQFLNDFIPEEYLLGELGFCLANYQSAVQFFVNKDQNERK